MSMFASKFRVVDAVQWLKHGDHKLVTEVPASSSLWDAAGGQLAPHYGYFHGGHGVPATIVTPGSYVVTDKNDVVTIWTKDLFDAEFQEITPDVTAAIVVSMQKAYTEGIVHGAHGSGLLLTPAQCAAMFRAAVNTLAGR